MYIINKPSALIEQMQIWARENKATNLFINHAIIYMNMGMERGIDPVIAYVQYALESNFGRYDKRSSLDKTYNNPCGLRLLIDRGKSRSSFSFKRFRTWNEGIEAHLDHLALVAGVDGYPKQETHDPRHMENLFNTCVTVKDLQDNWTGMKDYAKQIEWNVKIIQNTPLENEGNINVLKDQIKVLKNRIQEKDFELVKLKKEVKNLEGKIKTLTESKETYEYDNEKLKEELNEYRYIITKIKNFMEN